jgi:bloom syndrome protein
MALTASANGEGRAKITRILGLRDPLTVRVSLNRQNIRYEVRYPDAFAANISQDDDLVALLRGPDATGQPLRCGIIYCRSKKECDRVAALLRQSNLPSAAYHADLTDGEREKVQANWIAGIIYFTVATVAFGMGALVLALAAALTMETCG